MLFAVNTGDGEVILKVEALRTVFKCFSKNQPQSNNYLRFYNIKKKPWFIAPALTK